MAHLLKGWICLRFGAGPDTTGAARAAAHVANYLRCSIKRCLASRTFSRQYRACLQRLAFLLHFKKDFQYARA